MQKINKKRIREEKGQRETGTLESLAGIEIKCESI